jgi:hypothetical protein
VQVGVAGDTVGEQRPDVLLVVMLGEHHDPTARQHGSDRVSQVDALSRMGRRHPDVGEQHVGLDPLGQLHRLGRVACAADDLDVGLFFEQAPETLARDEVVFRDEHPHPGRHPLMMALRRYRGGRDG